MIYLRFMHWNLCIYLTSMLHVMFNTSPAIVIQIAKKRGLDKGDFKNFQPVSNLTLLSKLLERVGSRLLTDFLEMNNMNNLFSASQITYRKFHSTESALLKVYSDICGLLDLSTAFETVDHHILLQQLELSFGIVD